MNWLHQRLRQLWLCLTRSGRQPPAAPAAPPDAPAEDAPTPARPPTPLAQRPAVVRFIQEVPGRTPEDYQRRLDARQAALDRIGPEVRLEWVVLDEDGIPVASFTAQPIPPATPETDHG